MSRKRQPEPKVNVTARHFFNLPVLHRGSRRLSSYFTAQTVKLDQRSLANYFRTRFPRHTVFFPDTCFTMTRLKAKANGRLCAFGRGSSSKVQRNRAPKVRRSEFLSFLSGRCCFITGPRMGEAIWDQLLEHRIGVTELVLRELAGWLMLPFRHSRIWRLIMSARSDKDGPVWIDRPDRWTREHLLGIEYYVNVLAERKRFARWLALRFEEQTGRPPADVERNRLLQKGWAQRDCHVFRPGEEEIRTGRNVFTDEELVVTACAVGLCSGNDTVVVTRDRGVFDQFAKLTNLLIIHYQAMLFAERYAAAHTSFEITPMPTGDPDIDAYFVAENSFLVRKPVSPDQFVDWLLPRECAPMRLHCILVGGEADPFSFDHCFLEAERDMGRIIRMKGRTRGWNTDRIRGRNCHVTGFPRTIPEPRHFVALVQDREDYSADGELAFPKLDLAHTLYHIEVLSEPTSLGT